MAAGLPREREKADQNVSLPKKGPVATRRHNDTALRRSGVGNGSTRTAEAEWRQPLDDRLPEHPEAEHADPAVCRLPAGRACPLPSDCCARYALRLR